MRMNRTEVAIDFDWITSYSHNRLNLVEKYRRWFSSDARVLTNAWWSIHVWCHFVYLWKIRIKTNKPSFASISVKRKCRNGSVFRVLCSLLYRSFFFSKWFEIKCLEAMWVCSLCTFFTHITDYRLSLQNCRLINYLKWKCIENGNRNDNGNIGCK